MKSIVVLILLSLSIVSSLSIKQFSNSQEENASNGISGEFEKYWYAGEAELSRYELHQARYGEIHQGEAVLIFVTEDFDNKKQVKHEWGSRDDVTSVLKLNFTKKFFTGLYPYSMMSSVFTPIQGDKTPKVTTSSQEWCGHTFTQLNLRKKEYDVQLMSYFQQEGDQNFKIKGALLEDEIWNRIRINPKTLPIGEIEIIPGTMFQRLKHRNIKVERASAFLESVNDENLSSSPMLRYSIQYEELPRSLSILFEEQFPHAILSWEESYPSGFGPNAQNMSTKAVRTHSIKSDYWTKNDVADAAMRAELGLGEASN